MLLYILRVGDSSFLGKTASEDMQILRITTQYVWCASWRINCVRQRAVWQRKNPMHDDFSNVWADFNY